MGELDLPTSQGASSGFVNADFRPAWWLPSGHLQTLWPTVSRRRPVISLTRERLELPDGDFLDLDWARTARTVNSKAAASGHDATPVVIVVHGLEGSSDSGYARGLLRAVTNRGWHGVLMHFRSCSGEMNRLERTYHAGETTDFSSVIEHLHQRFPDAPLAAVGFSLGGNMLLKWLGEQGAAQPDSTPVLRAAAAVSVPLELGKSAARLTRGASRLYEWWLLRSLREKIVTKFRGRAAPPEVRTEEAHGAWRHIIDFDDAVTAPLHGFASAHEYYTRSSARQYLRHIRCPTLIVHAADDPFMTADLVPAAGELGPGVRFELSRRGGHVGFISGHVPLRPEYWLEQRLPTHLAHWI